MVSWDTFQVENTEITDNQNKIYIALVSEESEEQRYDDFLKNNIKARNPNDSKMEKPTKNYKKWLPEWEL